MAERSARAGPGRAVWFTAPGAVAVRPAPVPEPGPGEALVATVVSAISAGTELLVYRGQAPADLPVDASLPAYAGAGGFRFPLRYGYAAVGRVAALGAGVEPAWLGRLGFAFEPHASHFAAPVSALQPVPPDVAPEAAAFLPNVETAVNLVLDGAPLIGERVAVLGQGVVGLLTTGLLARFPLAALAALDPIPARRVWSRQLGATAALDPREPDVLDRLLDALGGRPDLVFELSGAPEALNLAVRAAGFDARIVVGSWYGTRPAALELGGRFHRERLRLISSQVSTLAPALAGRWDKPRRLATAWHHLRALDPARLISHRYPVTAAADAYRQLDQRPGETLQVLLTY